MNEYDALMNAWVEEHENEPDKGYENYHIKTKGTVGYIPKESFFIDGIICEDEYEKADNKVLYIAKECNAWEYGKANSVSKENRLDMDKFFARIECQKGNKTKNRFLKGMAMLQNAILDNNYDTPNKDTSNLSKAAMINLNKRGGYSWCIWKTLDSYVNEYKDELRRQIEIINPTVIVCCGESVKHLVKKYNLAEGYNNNQIKCAYHPSCFLISDYNKLQFLKTQNKEFISNNKAENLAHKAEKNTDVYGVILDTNNRWVGQNTEQNMLKKNQAQTYGSAKDSINRIDEGTYVMFYSSGKGIVAIGKAKSSLGYDDKFDALWRDVEPIVPLDFQKAINTPNHIPPSEVKRIVYEKQNKGFWWTGTVKNIELNKASVCELISHLKREYERK